MAKKEESREVARMESRAVVPYTGPTYELAKHDPDELKELFEANLGDGETIGEFDFERINVPAGGALAWSVPDINGEPEQVKEINGIMLHSGRRRAFWKIPFSDSGGGSPPDCSSRDGKVGRGWIRGESVETHPEPTRRPCDTCPMSQWGSKLPDEPKDNQQACNDRRIIALARQGDMLPLVIDLAPTSIKPLKKFLTNMVGQGLNVHRTPIRLRLKKEESRMGIPHSVVMPCVQLEGNPPMPVQLSDKDFERMKAAAAAFKPIFATIEVVQETANEPS